MRHLLAPLLLGLAGCSAGSDIKDTGGPTTTGPTDVLEPPDLVGAYDVAWEPTADCSSATEPFDWGAGDLVITGLAGAMTYDFGEISVPGTVDAAFAFDLGGDATTPGGTAITVDGTGTVIQNFAGTTLDGDLVVAWTEGDVRCEAAGIFTATGVTQ